MFHVWEGTLYSAIIKYIYAFIVIPYKATCNIETVPSLATSLLGSHRVSRRKPYVFYPVLLYFTRLNA